MTTKIEKWIDDNILTVGLVASMGCAGFSLWLVYKIAQGLFHLADKLIDKL